MTTNEERARQAEMDAARALEVEEERLSLTERRSAIRKLRALGAPPMPQFLAKAVRDWVRQELVPEALIRLADIGMGITTFDVPTMAGNIVSIPAPAGVQVDALSKLVDIGVPRQVGLTDASGLELPGVFAMGALELEQVQDAQLSERFHGGNGNGNGNGHGPAGAALLASGNGSNPDDLTNDVAQLSPSVQTGDYTIVEMDEATRAPADGERPGEVPPPPVSKLPTLEQVILAKRRAQRRANSQRREDDAP